MNRRAVLLALLSISCLATGALIYILFRTKSLLMFQWTGKLGLNDLIEAMRNQSHRFEISLPFWTIFSLPYALWVFAYMLAIDVIWGSSKPLARHVWFWSVPVAAVASELAQAGHIIPGRFDQMDLSTLIVASILGFGVSNLHRPQEGIATT